MCVFFLFWFWAGNDVLGGESRKAIFCETCTVQRFFHLYHINNIHTFFFFTSLICPYFQLKFTHLHFSGNAEAIDIEHIKVGSFYEIDHSKLTPQTPDQLRSIRVVMVHIIHTKPTIFITFILIFHTFFY